MKFYYKGQKVRTSKTHEYTHAVIREYEDGSFGLFSCSGSYDLALKTLNSLLNKSQESIRNYQTRVIAKESGSSYCFNNDGRYTFKVILTDKSIEELKAELKKRQDQLEWQKEHFKVVELERAE